MFRQSSFSLSLFINNYVKIQFLKMLYSKIFKVVVIIFLGWTLITFSDGHKGWEIPSRSRAIAFSPNSQMLATASGDRNYGDSSTVEIRKVSDGKIIKSFDFKSANSIAFSSDNKMIAAVNEAGDVNVWRISNGYIIHSSEKALRYARRIIFLAFTPDGKTLIASKTAKTQPNSQPIPSVVAWDLETKKVKYTLPESSSCAAISLDRKVLVSSAYQQPFLFHQLEDGTLIEQVKKDVDVCLDLNFSNDEKSLVFTTLIGDQYTGKRPTQILNLQNGKSYQRSLSGWFKRKTDFTTDVELSPDGQFLAKSYAVEQPTSNLFGWPDSLFPKGLFGKIRIWHLKSGIQVAVLRGHWINTKAISFSPDGKWLASVGGDNENNRIRLWRMPFYIGWLRSIGIYGLLGTFIYWRRKNLVDWINR